MLAIDMPMPKDCFDCPMSHLAYYGTLGGKHYCPIREYKGARSEACEVRMEWTKRPEWCPLMEIKQEEDK